VDVAQVLRTSKLTRWQTAAGYVGIGKCAVVDWAAALVDVGSGVHPNPTSRSLTAHVQDVHHQPVVITGGDRPSTR